MTLVVILLAPALAALATMRVQVRYLKEVALTGTAVALGLSLVAMLAAARGAPLEATAAWAPAAGLTFKLAADGVSASLLLLNSGIGALALLSTRPERLHRPHLFVAMLLLAQSAAAGVLLAQDMVLFFIFWEVVLVPFFVLIAIYGEGEREKAALKLLIYTSLGSLAMLVSIASLFVLSGSHSFLINDLAASGQAFFLGISAAHLVFLGFAIAFAIKTPLFPFHGWMAEAYTACPTPALMVLAGVVSKLGPYGFYRVAIRLEPGAARDLSGLLMTLAAVGIVYGALMALRQRDAKRTIVYLSLSHMCFITLGIVSLTPAGLSGGSIQMVNHGVLIASLFFIVGHIEQRLGTRDRGRLAGLAASAPMFAGIFLLLSLATLGLPGLNGFVGEYLIMAGAYSRSWPILVLAAIGVVLASWYTLRLYQGVMTGSPLVTLEEEGEHRADLARVELTSLELGILVPLAAAALLIGVFPAPLASLVNQGVAPLTRLLAGGG
ncbi:MAG TPA: NADH-quinone oxidoreductase subunit M [Candidatus Dormibacteraeota bacterium]|nr:NADH-quinone oxidoreductase subunit M [Candidatus Dormibacteraeota bacterium]